MQEQVLELRPSWWNYFAHFLFFFLIIPLIVAVWQKFSLVFRVYGDRINLETGILSKNTKDVFISDVRTIDVKQSLFQRIVGIGDVMIATAGTSGYEDMARGLPNPKRVRDTIMTRRQQLLSRD
jgi:uncharacterized membrane protein YdbT with pleckstrin-like domain